MTKMQSYNANGWKGFVNTEWIDAFDDLDQWLEQNPGETIVEKPTRTVTRVAMANSILYVKRVETLAVGDGRFLRNLTRKLRWLLRPSRAISVMKTTMKMLEAGVPCPTPILMTRKRTRENANRHLHHPGSQGRQSQEAPGGHGKRPG